MRLYINDNDQSRNPPNSYQMGNDMKCWSLRVYTVGRERGDGLFEKEQKKVKIEVMAAPVGAAA